MKNFNYNDYVTLLNQEVVKTNAKKLLKESDEEQDDNWRAPADDTSTFEKEPSSKDLKKVGNNSYQSKSHQLLQLLNQKDELLSRFKKGELSIDAYKQAIGTIPQQIIALRKDLETMTTPEEEPVDENNISPEPGDQPEPPVEESNDEKLGKANDAIDKAIRALGKAKEAPGSHERTVNKNIPNRMYPKDSMDVHEQSVIRPYSIIGLMR